MLSRSGSYGIATSRAHRFLEETERHVQLAGGHHSWVARL